jgi:hypothetical protein
MKFSSVNRTHADCSVFSGEARKCGGTQPEAASSVQPARNRTKKATPRYIRAWGDTGVKSFIRRFLGGSAGATGVLSGKGATLTCMTYVSG